MDSENKTTSTDTVWKAKYTELVAQSDRLEKEQGVTEKLLCRTIIRLTLAANGLDAALDPHLKKLRTLLKAGVKNERLREQVDAVSEALIRAEDGDETTVSFDAALLFDFLRYCAKGEDEEVAISALHDDYTNNKFSDLNSLFRAVGSAFGEKEAKATSKPGLLGRLFGRSKKSEVNEQFDPALQKELLGRLLDSLDVPSYLQHQLETLKQQAEKDSGDSSLFFKILEDTIALLLRIKSKIKEEQREIEAFLSDVTSQIKKIGSGSEVMQSFFHESNVARDQLASCVSSNVNELTQESQQATSLDDLRSSVKSKLATLSSQVEEHLSNDKSRAEKAEEKLEEMAQAIKVMEAETAGLKSSINLKHDLAYTDSLTGLPNRLAYDERITNELARWKRFKESFTLLVWDIDHFKSINDRFGHQAGDVALRKISGILSAAMRETDFVARFGGEEFVMFLPGATKDQALSKANVIRGKIKGCGFNSKGKPIEITASCGLTQFQDGDTPETVFDRADKALYQAKNGGRNQCVFG
ncbi:MAG: hypothetical protein DRQ56_00855 [Gammaproteobacteria bacterium]|nr:MAG: hypothetical protein DRQ56_00855 [Gammaproteobacteria bacterium]